MTRTFWLLVFAWLAVLQGCVYRPLGFFGGDNTRSSEGIRQRILDAEQRLPAAASSQLPMSQYPRALPVKHLPSPVIEVNSAVRQQINQLTQAQGGGSFVSNALERREEHYPLLEEIFRDEGVPPEIINVALIESGFNTDAKSSAGR